jgi:hypothetical protein
VLSGDATGWEYEIASGYTLPDGLAIDEDTGQITGAPASEDEINTDYIEIKVKATKGSNSILSNPFDIVVRPEDPAQQLRPILLFDSDEKWRPLNVETLVDEEYPGSPAVKHQLCDPSCSSITRLEDLDETGVTGDYLDLEGNANTLGPLDLPGFEEIPSISLSDQADNYQAADDVCLTGDMQECDNNSNSLYWQAIFDEENNVTYYDYWAYYRFNQYNLSNLNVISPFLYLFSEFEFPIGAAEFSDLDSGDHEGDWEGLVVASDNEDDPTGFDWVGMDAHGNTWKYLPGVLYCDSIIAEESCLQADNKKGQRVVAYAAEGSHATYPRPCDENCNQTDSEGDVLVGVDIPGYGNVGIASERDFDGEVAWNQNNSESNLIEMPTSADEWPDWDGQWGAGSPVESPRNQTRGSFPWDAGECTERYSEFQDCDEEILLRSTDGINVEDDCSPWDGPFVQVAICNNESESLISIKEETSKSQNTLTDSVLGLSQLVSDKPLELNDRIEIIGSIPKGTNITVRTDTLHKDVINETTFEIEQPLPRNSYFIVSSRNNKRVKTELFCQEIIRELKLNCFLKTILKL